MGDILEKGDEIMTAAELYQILDDKNKKITLKEYQEILYQLNLDVESEIRKLTKEDVSIKWYYNGGMNGFKFALNLSEHIKDDEDL